MLVLVGPGVSANAAESDGGSDAATSVRIVNEDVPLAGR